LYALGPGVARDGKAVDSRQHDVDDRRVVALAQQMIESGLAIVNDVGRKFLSLEHLRDGICNRRIVLDD
jgi:hypothetical protein